MKIVLHRNVPAGDPWNWWSLCWNYSGDEAIGPQAWMRPFPEGTACYMPEHLDVIPALADTQYRWIGGPVLPSGR